ncbi:MAG: ABC transporter ATP-binding protein [Proteobacteria bacterium]|nr:ABC transporter ATP-binding protein [Pseudomonadota bacterium]
MNDTAFLAAHGLTRYYGARQALFDVDIVLARGEILGFLGQNGAGKSTTMQCLCGALAPHGGSVEIGGHSLASAPTAAKSLLGYLPEIPPLYRDMRVDDYLGACARLHGVAISAVAEAVARARQRCGLNDVGARLVGHLSKGYQQRVGIAQAIVHEPKVLVLDEPTAGLDPGQIREVRELVRELGSERAIIVSTHILPEVRALASRFMILHHGRVVHDAPASDTRRLRVRLRRDPGAAALAALAGVEHVTASARGWLLTVTGDAEAAAEAFAKAAVAADWGVLEIDPDFDDLEHLFMELTSGAAASVAA